MLVDSLGKFGPYPNGFRIHVVHISDAESLDIIEHAKMKGLPITVETCPHYLLFADEEIGMGETEYKCAPPLRSKTNREKLRRALLDGRIDSVSSDHSPSPASMKLKDEGNFLRAWGGISGIQYTLPATWEAMLQANPSISPSELHKYLSVFPAKLVGMRHLRGRLMPGLEADIVVWNPEVLADTTLHGCLQKQKLSPYIGKSLRGRVVATFVGGSLVFDAEKGPSTTSCGKPLLKNSFRNDPRS